MLERISVVIITRNAAETLRETLDSTRQFAETVVYDNGSEDETLAIAAEYPNVTVHQGDFAGFGPTKNRAVDLARYDWVFSLDADEVVSEELVTFLRSWSPQSENVAGIVRRDNFLMGKQVDKAGWGADWLVRVFHRGTHRFNDNAVHESVPTGPHTIAEKLPHPIRHNAVRHLGQFLQKIDRYTEIRRETMTRTYHPFIIVLKALFAFFRSFALKGGFLAGWRGLVIAWNESNGVFYKYMKVYADQNR